MSACFVLRHGRLVTEDGVRFSDLLVEDGRITKIAPSIPAEGLPVVDAAHALVMPPFTDIGCRFFDPAHPGRDRAETASAAATVGGYRRLLTLPNESDGADPRVHSARPLGTPEQIAKGGSQIYFDGDLPLSPRERRELFLACAQSNSLYLTRALEPSLLLGAVSTGRAARLCGDHGIPYSAETVAVAEALLLAEESGCRLHLLAVASADALTLIREAKRRGVNVTCGVSPFHLAMTDEDIAFYGAMGKLLPPLRSRRDREALREGLLDGMIDCVCSLHTPLTKAEKGTDVKTAPFGLASIETTLSALLTYLPAMADRPTRLAEVMALSPAAILGESVSLAVGTPADFVLVSPHTEIVVSEHSLKSKSVNTPFLGQTLHGVVRALYLGGRRM